MMLTTLATGLALAAAVAVPVSAPAIAPGLAPAAAPVSAAADDVDAAGTVSTEINLGRFPMSTLEWYTVPTEECPAEAPYLSHDEYHPGSGWNLPRGVEIKSQSTDPGQLGVTIWPAVKAFDIDGQTWIRQTGIAATSTITNYVVAVPGQAKNNWVEVVLHCTN